MKKINVIQARKQFEKGNTIYLLPNKVAYNNCWVTPYRINKNELEDKTLDFGKIINNYSYYNCNSELGKSIAYYMEDMAK